MNDKKKAYIISETHWDREWYLTFEQFRAKLLKLTDKLLNILDKNEKFKHWTFDGQTIVLEDYLEVKPYEKTHLKKYIENERIDIGPWYILPDEFLISGESLIRNLLRGHRIAKEFGNIMKVGYVPDPFGHISQMPQILRGFNINSFIFMRGMGNQGEELGTEFWWEAPDGSRVLAIWLKEGYGNIAGLPEDIEDAADRIVDVLERLNPYVKTNNFLLMNGSDHLEPQPHIPEVIDYLNKQYSDWEFMHARLEDYVKAVLNENKDLRTYRGEFRGAKYHYLLTGVLSSRAYLKRMNEEAQRLIEKYIEPLSTISLIMTGHYDDGQIDTMWKYLLQNQPHDSICGCSIDEVHQDNEQRYRWIQEIGQIVLDNIMENIQTRLPSGRKLFIFNPNPWEISGVVMVSFKLSDVALVKQSPRYAITNVNPKDKLESSKNEIHLALMKAYGWDPSPENEISSESHTTFTFDFTNALRFMGIPEKRVSKTISIFNVQVNNDLEIENVFARKHFADDIIPKNFVVKNNKGTELKTQIIKFEPIINNDSNIISEKDFLVHMAIEVDKIPALGYRCFDIYPKYENEHQRDSTNAILENNLLKIEINNKNGTITIYDKETNITYKNLHIFEDIEDAGDEYDYSPAIHSTKYTTIDNPPKIVIEKIEKGPLVQFAKLRIDWLLPKSLTYDMSQRSKEMETLTINTTIILKKNSKIVEFETVIENRIKDHRLRVLFPTYTNSKKSISDSLFDVITRSTELPKQDDWVQKLIGTHPFRKFVDVSNANHGLTLFAFGIPEYQLLQDENSTLALTLFRSIGRLSGLAMKTRTLPAGPIIDTPEAQCMRSMKFNYAIYLHREKWDKAKVAKYANQFYTRILSQVYYNYSGTEIHEKSFVKISSEDILLSAFKKSEDSNDVILRLWNPLNKKVDTEVKLWDKVNKIIETTLEEKSENIISADTDQFSITIKPKEIKTFKIKM